jgi:hypothetical protein
VPRRVNLIEKLFVPRDSVATTAIRGMPGAGIRPPGTTSNTTPDKDDVVTAVSGVGCVGLRESQAAVSTATQSTPAIEPMAPGS